MATINSLTNHRPAAGCVHTQRICRPQGLNTLPPLEAVMLVHTILFSSRCQQEKPPHSLFEYCTTSSNITSLGSQVCGALIPDTRHRPPPAHHQTVIYQNKYFMNPSHRSVTGTPRRTPSAYYPHLLGGLHTVQYLGCCGQWQCVCAVA